ncbi:TPA: hypothetical protein N0H21_001300 [Pseudomonas aeruginosa]|nr:hypothetical protein [Pseudomonas aeruginosa]
MEDINNKQIISEWNFIFLMSILTLVNSIILVCIFIYAGKEITELNLYRFGLFVSVIANICSLKLISRFRKTHEKILQNETHKIRTFVFFTALFMLINAHIIIMKVDFATILLGFFTAIVAIDGIMKFNEQ